MNSCSETEFFDIIEQYGWGTKTVDYDAIKRDIMSKFTKSQSNQLQATFTILYRRLYNFVTLYEKQNDVSCDCGDDSFDDLLSHIIGMGRNEYNNSLDNPGLVIDRAHKYNFTESFAYALPTNYSYDYEDEYKDDE